jgi:hypothetical protein
VLETALGTQATFFLLSHSLSCSYSTRVGMAVSYDVAVWDVIMDHVDAMLTIGTYSVHGGLCL